MPLDNLTFAAIAFLPMPCAAHRSPPPRPSGATLVFVEALPEHSGLIPSDMLTGSAKPFPQHKQTAFAASIGVSKIPIDTLSLLNASMPRAARIKNPAQASPATTGTARESASALAVAR
jgi:hypothetical protein